MPLRYESFIKPEGLSGKEKKELRRQHRESESAQRKEKSRQGENYGDTKISRRIPPEISEAVQIRDTGRDFGRPNHKCDRPGPPHHIIHFEKFLNNEVVGNPHTEENLESPCRECHDLAHAMNIPSGTSIETFFRKKFKTFD